jgi:nitrogen fixation-related uncharacterized protein
MSILVLVIGIAILAAVLVATGFFVTTIMKDDE